MTQHPLADAVLSADKPKLLIVDDSESIRAQMRWALGSEYEVYLAEDRHSALEALRREHPPLVMLDLGLPPHAQDVTEGFHTLKDTLREQAGTKIVVVTGRHEREHAHNAIAQGAYDFFCKPIELEEIKIVLRRALHVYQLEQEYRDLQHRVSVKSFAEMLGTSRQMREVFAIIRKVANTDVPVLIVGESGTGKELAARAIHQKSARKNSPFVVINCGAIPETLLESELFGHEKGAFTGAHIQRKGRIELAQGGTLFLDEIGDLSVGLQVKLLRFVQERQIERIGGREPIGINTRVIAATNTELKQAIKEGRFRDDLYYRLGVITIALPPLRERGEDIMLIAKVLLGRAAAEVGKVISGFTEDAQSMIRLYPWPGNVRELENRVKRAVIMSERQMVNPMDLELDGLPLQRDAISLREARKALESKLIQQAIARHRGNLTRVADDLGISRPTLYELIGKLGIKR